MLRVVVLLFLSFGSVTTWAQSAVRQEGEGWFQAATRSFVPDKRTPKIRSGSASVPSGAFLYSMGQPHIVFSKRANWSDVDKNLIPEWQKSEEDLVFSFKSLRDARFFKSPTNSNFLRRLTWLYPDDGCFVRADWMDRLLEKWGEQGGAKVFAFGDLRAKTENSPSGEVRWWYHVAITYKKNDRIFVLDPALEPHRPLLFDEWVEKISVDPSEVSFSVCHRKASGPFSNCLKPQARPDYDLEKFQSELMIREWDRVLQMRKVPEKILGDEPPWLSVQQ